ncbi:MAG: hypothetical protein A2315_00335 [Ignavibacteria bacterium RIFOXYB2_FULL_35_12]|nr:MAG: hypothetical protein A2006_08890 [Ignavibacteria bacterium GWC2_35_8]OGU58912.1 MAG: hypothetical protein A2X60_09290 [Ignavibacteria bacterium GWF2_35_20]OGU90333.1 MAG: hypothetical protein A3K31_09570 [Ignavibacteria bacterium RIFOXYA12_FULL_35_25]OGU95999.1 MAG: hypothetical protein A2347_01325 [Ignavibacteria bacterium RIFOXYB12_FULL_35_14]OGU99362.1 MAG: hypothetical protein A2455_03085 [Ignavibacteria bacterium RIFOXYC2_FULL_35_16]OGV02730.1 MAG: hypothetical protein A2315_00335
MNSLSEDLQKPKNRIQEFREITQRVLKYIPDVLDEEAEFSGYIICSSNIAGTRKSIRPFRNNLFLRNPKTFDNDFKRFESILKQLKTGKRDFKEDDYDLVDGVIYTIQQSMGIGLDLMVQSNSARKHVGNRFEELIRTLFDELGISLKKVVLRIPYETDEGEKYYRCETDVIISPFKKVRSDSKTIHPDEIVVSLKTTTKDRMPKIFIDKVLMERFVEHPVKVLGISQNDIQRKEGDSETKISYTFVPNLFMVYTRFLAQLEGYYYLDLPSKAFEKPFNRYIFPFSKLILNDIWKMLRP